MTTGELERHLEGCRQWASQSQQAVYRHFYGLGIHVSLRYAQSREEAEEMCHDGFLRVFANIHTLEKPTAIKGWMTRIFVLAAIDHYRKYRRSQPPIEELELAVHHSADLPEALDQLSYEEKLALVQSLPTSFRVAFNLCVIEEYPYPEAAALLGITEAALRSNLAKARLRLKSMINAQLAAPANAAK